MLWPQEPSIGENRRTQEDLSSPKHNSAKAKTTAASTNIRFDPNYDRYNPAKTHLHYLF
jgi:hypothetical protein